jgi:hypothetical protein
VIICCYAVGSSVSPNGSRDTLEGGRDHKTKRRLPLGRERVSTTSSESHESDRVGSLSPEQSPSVTDFPTPMLVSANNPSMSSRPQGTTTVRFSPSTTNLNKRMSSSMSSIPSSFRGAPDGLQRPFSRSTLPYKNLGSVDKSSRSPLIEKGFVPPPPPVSFDASWDTGTSVDDDVNNQSERRSRRNSLSSGNSSDDDCHSKSSEDYSYTGEMFARSQSLSESASPCPDFDIGKRKKIQSRSMSLSPAEKKRSLTLPRTDARSSLCPTSKRLYAKEKALTLPSQMTPQKVKSFDRLSAPLGVFRTKSMDTLDSRDRAHSISDLPVQLQSNQKPPPLVRRPSVPVSQMLFEPQSNVQNLRSRSHSPLPKFKKKTLKKHGRETSVPQTSTPTVIQNPFLNAIDEPDNSSDDNVMFDPLEALAIKADSVRKESVDSIVSVSSMPVVQVWGPGQTNLMRSSSVTVYDRNFGTSEHTKTSPSLKRCYRLSQEMVIDTYEDFNLCLADCSEYLKRKQKSPHRLCQFATKSWVDVLEKGLTNSLQLAKIQGSSNKLRWSVWEICRTECEYFTHLLSARDVCMETMKKLKAKGHLEMINIDEVFCNLTEICLVSEGWAEQLLSLFEGKPADEAGDILGLLQIFSQFDAVVTGPYTQYSYNYTKLTRLNLFGDWHSDPNFVKYHTWCRERSGRVSLEQLLIAPVRRFSDYVILLKEVLKHCPLKYVPELKERISSVDGSIANLNKEVENKEVYNIVAELERFLHWPAATDMERSGIFVPPGLENLLEEKQGLTFLADGDRKMIYNKALTLRDSNGRTDMFVFLFDDLLLMTKFKGRQRNSSSRTFHKLSSGKYTVYKQPLPLDRVKVFSIANSPGLENAFTVVHYSRFLQVIGAYTFQATSETDKIKWIEELTEAQTSWQAQQQS